MKNYRTIRGKQIHVNQLATESRKYTVKHTKVPKSSMPSTGEWEEKKYPQPKRLRKRKRGFKFVKNGDAYVKIRYDYPSEFPRIEVPKITVEDKIEMTQKLKLAKWEKRNPRPVPQDSDQKDIFENQFVPEWEQRRNKEIERIRDFAVSLYHKLVLTGRYQPTEGKFEEKKVGELKDKNQEGNKINELCPTKSKLLKMAKELTNTAAKEDKSLVATHLKDHKGERGRIILPDKIAA